MVSEPKGQVNGPKWLNYLLQSNAVSYDWSLKVMTFPTPFVYLKIQSKYDILPFNVIT